MTVTKAATLVAVAVTGVLVVSACTGSPEPTGSLVADTTTSATPTPTTTITATPPPSASPTDAPSADPGTALAPISQAAAYNECVPWASVSSSNPAAVTVDSEEDSTIIRRADGQWFLHIPYDDPAVSDPNPSVMVCVIGGSDAEPAVDFANRSSLIDPLPYSPDNWEDQVATH